jgi:hypothetical protein
MKANPLVAITAAALCLAAGAAAIVPLWPKGQMPGRGSTGPERELPARGDNVIRLFESDFDQMIKKLSEPKNPKPPT